MSVKDLAKIDSNSYSPQKQTVRNPGSKAFTKQLADPSRKDTFTPSLDDLSGKGYRNGGRANTSVLNRGSRITDTDVALGPNQTTLSRSSFEQDTTFRNAGSVLNPGRSAGLAGTQTDPAMRYEFLRQTTGQSDEVQQTARFSTGDQTVNGSAAVEPSPNAKARTHDSIIEREKTDSQSAMNAVSEESRARESRDKTIRTAMFRDAVSDQTGGDPMLDVLG